MAEMAFDAFCDAVADAVEYAMDMGGGECFLCLVLGGRMDNPIPERYATTYLMERGWSDQGVAIILGLIKEAEAVERVDDDGSVVTDPFSTLVGAEYPLVGDADCNQARVQWLREGAPAFWRK